jgi:hypothetical protein
MIVGVVGHHNDRMYIHTKPAQYSDDTESTDESTPTARPCAKCIHTLTIANDGQSCKLWY